MWKTNSKPKKPESVDIPELAEELSPEELQRDIRHRLVGLLARREHSRAELLHKMQERGFPGEQVAAVLDELAQANLQSDARFAESFVYARVQRGQGPQKIRAELRARHVSDALIEQALATAGADWYALAQQAWQKRFGQPPTDFSERARQARFLQNRGFGHEHIQFALNFAE